MVRPQGCKAELPVGKGSEGEFPARNGGPVRIVIPAPTRSDATAARLLSVEVAVRWKPKPRAV
jgi:hypothetical protein